MGKPTVYREVVAEQILEEIALGKSLQSICRRPGMPPYRTVVSWVLRNYRGFEDRYWRARRQQCLHLSEEIITIADEAVGADMAGANVAKLRCDARKWTLARMDSSRWSEAVTYQHQHQLGGGATIQIFLPAKGSDHDGGRVIEGRATETRDDPASDDQSEARPRKP